VLFVCVFSYIERGEIEREREREREYADRKYVMYKGDKKKKCCFSVCLVT